MNKLELYSKIGIYWLCALHLRNNLIDSITIITVLQAEYVLS